MDNQPPIAPPASNDNIYVEQPHRSFSFRRLWLWVLLVVVGLAIVGGGIGVLAFKYNADSVGADYKTAAKKYLTNIHNAVDQPVTNPNDLVSSIRSFSKPTLEAALLPQLSKQYQSSQTLQTKVDKLTENLQTDLTEDGAVYTYVQDWKQNETTLQNLTDSKASTGTLIYLTSTLDRLNALYNELKAAHFPDDLKTPQANLLKQYGAARDIWASATAAYQNGMTDEYTRTLATYPVQKAQADAALKPINAYYDGLSSQVHKTIDQFKKDINNL